jgi:subtilisin family serine protease
MMTFTLRRFTNRGLLLRWPMLAAILSLTFCLSLEFAATYKPSSQPATAATPESSSADAEANATCLVRAEHLERLGVAAWHKAGVRGQGVKVAVLDSGFRGYRQHLGHALSERVKTKSLRSDGDLEAKPSQHGILCGEVVHTLAPDAEIMFANWEPDRPDEFLQAVRWAREQGAQVLTCSVIIPSWSDCEGGGSVHRELARILGAGDKPGDALFFASAGNTAQRHWSGPFHDSGDGSHEWSTGCQDNAVEPWGGETVSVELCCAAAGTFQLSVYDATAQETVGTSVTAVANDYGCAIVRFLPRDNHAYMARVCQSTNRLASRALQGMRQGRPECRFHLVVLGGGLQIANTACSVPFPGDGAEVVAVGAVDAAGRRLAYSSCGCNSSNLKPDLVAPIPIASAWRSRPFSGTSAAAPQAAAMASLVWSRHPDWTAQRIREALKNDAQQLTTTRPDPETGYGRIHLP